MIEIALSRLSKNAASLISSIWSELFMMSMGEKLGIIDKNCLSRWEIVYHSWEIVCPSREIVCLGEKLCV